MDPDTLSPSNTPLSAFLREAETSAFENRGTKLSTGILIPTWDTMPNSYERLQTIMSNPQAIIVEARTTPDTPRRPEWSRWGERGLQRTWDPRYYYFSDTSYGGGAGTENWLGNAHDQQPELGIELVNAELGIRFLQIGIEQGKTTVLLCSSKGKKNERRHWKVIVEMLKLRVPDLQVIL